MRARSKTLGKTTMCELLEGMSTEIEGASHAGIRGRSDLVLLWRIERPGSRGVRVVVFRQQGNAIAGEVSPR